MSWQEVYIRLPRALAKRKDELGDLTRSLEGMAGQIQDQLEAQRALTRMVSHEVRSPLTRLKLVLDLMERAEDAKALLPRANNAIQSLDTLLEQMLTLSRLEANACPQNPKAIIGPSASEAGYKSGASRPRKKAFVSMARSTIRFGL